MGSVLNLHFVKFYSSVQVSVEGEHHEKAVELLKAAPASVKLVVRYTPKVGNKIGQTVLFIC